MARSKKSLNFEQTLQELEALVKEMESGDMTLEDSLSAFEKGIQLTRECQTALQNAEQRVQKLVADGDTLRETALDAAINEADADLLDD